MIDTESQVEDGCRKDGLRRPAQACRCRCRSRCRCRRRSALAGSLSQVSKPCDDAAPNPYNSEGVDREVALVVTRSMVNVSQEPAVALRCCDLSYCALLLRPLPLQKSGVRGTTGSNPLVARPSPALGSLPHAMHQHLVGQLAPNRPTLRLHCRAARSMHHAPCTMHDAPSPCSEHASHPIQLTFGRRLSIETWWWDTAYTLYHDPAKPCVSKATLELERPRHAHVAW